MSEDTRERLDRWLFHARLCRTRVIAQEAAARGKVRVNGVRVEKPGARVRPGDVLTLALGGRVQAIRILGLAARRGAAFDAISLYEVVE